MRVDLVRAREVSSCIGVAAHVALDDRQVVPELRVLGAQPHRGRGVGEGVSRSSRAAEGPRQGVLGEDRGPRRERRLRLGHGGGGVGAGVVEMVGFEPRQLEVDRDPVGPVQRLDGTHQLVLLCRIRPPAHRVEDVTEQRGGGGEGQAVDGGGEPVGRARQVAARCCHAGPAHLGGPVLRTVALGPGVGRVGCVEVALPEVQVAEQHQDIGAVLG